jgi:hypothetical protein
MLKTLCFSFALLGCAAVGCSPHTADHGGGLDLSGTSAGDEDMAFPVGSDEDMAGPLIIAPLDQVVVAAPGQMPTVQYSAMVNGQSVAPAWTIDRGEIGAVGVANGLFTAGGVIAGKASITATLGAQKVSTTITVKFMQSQNGDPGYPAPAPGAGGFGGVGGSGPGPAASNGQTGVLAGAPTADATVKMLYPYDGTVWPRGLFAPLLQWNPAARNFDAVMIKLHSKNFDYTGTFAKNATPFVNIPLPQAVWKTLTYANEGTNDDITVTLVFEDISGTPTAIGPYTMTWKVAPGTLKGTVYYNSYGTALVTNSGEPSCATTDTINNCTKASPVRTGPAFGAATLAVRPGTTDPVVIAGTASANNSGCRVCHSVAANGSALITQYGPDYSISSLYALTNANAISAVAGANHNYPALSPDGSWFMSSSGGMINGDTKTQAWSAAGALITPQPTLPAGWTAFQAALPAFSPDGKHLAFNYWSSTAGAVTNDGKSLAVLDYDPANKVFSTFRKLDTPAAGVDTWSSFLPSNNAVVFEHETMSPAGFGFTRYGNQGELSWVDLATTTVHKLDKLNGVGYLPTYGAHTGAADATLNYEPTVNPVVSGGYAWVVFTSRRLYGNVATIAPTLSDPREYHWLDPTQYTTKKLWVAAIDLNAAPGTDPSHPAFYLPAQELIAGNARGFWTVDPCHADGTGCETGDECCGGYCRPGGDMGALICTNVQPMCSQEFEKCNVAADCCGVAQGFECINGKCSKSTPIP